MAKKTKKKEIRLIPDETLEPIKSSAVGEQSEYESEAYGIAAPDAGIETTVTKVIGSGGPVPIVAPKHNTVQLQPIIVPLAVVPYMSQDSDILRTEGEGARSVAQSAERQASYDNGRYPTSATSFQNVVEKDKKTHGDATRKRVFGLFMFLFGGMMSALFLIAYFKPDLFGAFSLEKLDAIGSLINWITKTGVAVDYVVTVLLTVCFAGAALALLGGAIALISGKYLGAFFIIFGFFATASMVACVVFKAINVTLSADVMPAYVLQCALAGATLLLAIVFVIVNAKMEDIAEEDNTASSMVI